MLACWRPEESAYVVKKALSHIHPPLYGTLSFSSFASYLDSLPSWLMLVIIATAILITPLWFLWPAPLEFPIDDTYIYFVYAQNLAEHGKLMFNSANERGVGSTSLLWVLLLTGGHTLGLSMHVSAKALGMASLAVVSAGLCLLLRPNLPDITWVHRRN
jgi:hypothetical protein